MAQPRRVCSTSSRYQIFSQQFSEASQQNLVTILPAFLQHIYSISVASLPHLFSTHLPQTCSEMLRKYCRDAGEMLERIAAKRCGHRTLTGLYDAISYMGRDECSSNGERPPHAVQRSEMYFDAVQPMANYRPNPCFRGDVLCCKIRLRRMNFAVGRAGSMGQEHGHRYYSAITKPPTKLYAKIIFLKLRHLKLECWRNPEINVPIFDFPVPTREKLKFR